MQTLLLFMKNKTTILVKMKLFLLTVVCLLVLRTHAGVQVSHCTYGVTMKELLKLAGISGGNLLSYVAKLKKENIDQTVLSRLTLKQLQDIGVKALGDRLKIHKFFANDGNDCTSSQCKNNGICQDGFRCFSCRCDRNSGYYGPSCNQKCPCKNGGHCQTTRTGFKCDCAPGYSGDLCETKFFTQDRFNKLEKHLAQLTAKLALAETQLNNNSNTIENLQNRRGKWKLYRANEVLNQLEKIQLHQVTPTYTQQLPVVLPKATRAILISVYCNFWNNNGHAYLNYEAHQKGNQKPEAKVYGYNTHYNVYANTFYYEQMIPWESDLSNEIVFKVTSSYKTGGNNNWYRVRFVGYITTD